MWTRRPGGVRRGGEHRDGGARGGLGGRTRGPRFQRTRGREMTVEASAILRANLADAHWLLEEVVGGLTDEQTHWAPPGTANTIAATYAHVVASEDVFVHETLQRGATPARGGWRGRDGVSLPAPRRGPA